MAVNSAAAFGAIVLTMAIWWPAGIGVALVVCGAATVLANRMLQTPVDRSDADDTELSVLLAAFGPDEALRT